MFQVNFSGYILIALCLMLLPLRWVLGAVLAVSVHELFHVVALCALRIKILGIGISGSGVVIQTEPMCQAAEAICALAGPAGSFTLLFWGRQFPEAALIALVQGCYNLLPIYPMDGGRFLRSVAPYALCRAMEVFTWILLLGTGIWLCFSQKLGFSAFFPLLWTTMLLIHGKFPCKE